MPESLAENITDTGFAFRGYNITNLGRSHELLQRADYKPIVQDCLERASAVCAEVLDRPVDLISRVREQDEPTLDCYAEAVGMVMAMELAQVQLLERCHGIRYAEARLAFGYSLGELSAVVCSGVFSFEEVLRVPVAMAGDCAHLADNVTMGVLFSRGPAIDESHAQHLCRVITAEGGGTIGLSAVLSPNTYLILGQGETLRRFKTMMHERLPKPAHLRINDYRWPPLHTPIVRQRHIPDRASVMMETMAGGFQPPTPPVLSLVTGKRSYDDLSARDLLRRWVDRPQRLWDAVYETLACGVTTVVHVGPAPNVIPATFRRLSENIKEQTSNRSLGSLGLRAAVGLARRPWLSALLPARGALLRAPTVKHVILEDWLLAQ